MPDQDIATVLAVFVVLVFMAVIGGMVWIAHGMKK
jgi:hypothetical protein